LVPERLATQRQLDLLTRRHPASRRILWRLERKPAVAANAAMPAQAALLPDDQAIRVGDLGDVGAEQRVSPNAADEQLVVEGRKETAGLRGPRRARGGIGRPRLTLS